MGNRERRIRHINDEQVKMAYVAGMDFPGVDEGESLNQILGTAYCEVRWDGPNSGRVEYADSGGWQEPTPFTVEDDGTIVFSWPEEEAF